MTQHIRCPLIDAQAMGLRHHGNMGMDFGRHTQHQFA
jgi:hypothetical protein